MDLAAVHHCRIHPAIGIARVGNSPQGHYLGPEVPGRAAPAPAGGKSPYKDEQGRLLRMACRFRIYAYDGQGRVLGELTAADAEITWTVHVANKKAAWYDFEIAMDIPEAAPPFHVCLRNEDVADRDSLVNDPGKRSIAGANAPPVPFEGGTVFGAPVALGELRTDGDGRLLFLGGHGVSASPPGPHHKEASTFANNDGWYDDTSDGPVDAVVVIRTGGQDRAVPVTGAWVVAAPPDYAPGTFDVTTMWDVVRDAAAKMDASLVVERPSFYRDVYPIFTRFSINQWVNSGFAEQFGWGQPLDFSTPAMERRLADASGTPAAVRTRGTLLAEFRDPSYPAMQPGAWPPMYGDEVDLPPKHPRQWMAVTDLQYGMLKRWAAGNFETTTPAWPAAFEDVPLAEQPRALDEAALEAALGGPFHPGCEVTWPMRQPILYEEPFRVKRRTGHEGDYGRTLDQPTALGPGGPLDGSGPGDLSRWMAVPWQTDTSSCLYAYVGWDYGLFLPTFWPARVPNNVITEEQYAVITDRMARPLARHDAFDPAHRKYWLRRLGDRRDQVATINRFVHEFGDAGVVAPLPGPGGRFPDVIHVETGNTMTWPPSLVLEAGRRGVRGVVARVVAWLRGRPPPPAEPAAAEPAGAGGPLPNPRDLR